MTFAQETFVRKYVSMIVTNDFIASESQEADVTVVFNPNGQRIINHTNQTKLF
jgi:hypothetical protein